MRLEPVMAYLSLILVLFATVTDLRRRRIPNYLTYSAVLLAFSYWTVRQEWYSLLWALGGLALGFVLLLLPYLKGIMGAGDLKLMAALGALVGPRILWNVFLYSLVSGGLVAVAYLLMRRRLWDGLKNTFRLLLRLGGRGRGPSPDEMEWQSLGKIPYGVAIAMGTAVVLVPMMR